MIKTTSGIDGLPVFNASVTGLPVYLDNFAVIDLAKGDPSRRRRFLDAFHMGADLLFSITNVAELAGPQGQSREAVKTFLDQLGPRWFPMEGIDPLQVVNRESHGTTGGETCVSRDLMKAYFDARTAHFSPDSGRVIDLSESFFCLGAVLDWLGPQRESIRENSAALDEALIARIAGYRTEFEKEPQWLDHNFPALPFDPSKPATFVYVNLVRTLILDAKAYQLKKGDGADFCHAVLGSAFSGVAALDKHWKRRVEGLPKPNKLARIYYQPELNKMVDDIESWVKSKQDRY